jgi:hypothetical protein
MVVDLNAVGGVEGVIGLERKLLVQVLLGRVPVDGCVDGRFIGEDLHNFTWDNTGSKCLKSRGLFTRGLKGGSISFLSRAAQSTSSKNGSSLISYTPPLPILYFGYGFIV